MPRSKSPKRRDGDTEVTLSLNEFVQLVAQGIGRLNERVTRLETIVAAHELERRPNPHKRERKG